MTLTISAAKFKAECLQLMDDVANGREEVIITKRGKPVARLVPVEPAPKKLFGCMEGTVTYLGDILSPIDEEWDAMKDQT